MKKIVLLLSLAFSLNCFSQIEKPITKGNMILSGGGTIQYSKLQSSTSNYSLFEISLTPGFGYFIIDNLAIGLNTNIGYSRQNDFKSYVLGVGPYVKYYFNNGLFLKMEAGYSYIHSVNSNSQKLKDYSLVPGVGYAFFINQKVSFEPCVSYRYVHSNYNESISKMNNLLLELKFNIFF